MTIEPLIDELLLIKDREVVVSGDIELEYNRNRYSLDRRELPADTCCSDLIQFLEAAIDSFDYQLSVRFHLRHLMDFFCWFDDINGVLEFGLLSSTRDRPHLAWRRIAIDELRKVVATFLNWTDTTQEVDSETNEKKDEEEVVIEEEGEDASDNTYEVIWPTTYISPPPTPSEPNLSIDRIRSGDEFRYEVWYTTIPKRKRQTHS